MTSDYKAEIWKAIELKRIQFEPVATKEVRKALIKATKPFYSAASKGTKENLTYYLALINDKELVKAYRYIYFDRGYIFYREEYNSLMKKYSKAASEDKFYSDMTSYFNQYIAKKITRVTNTIKKNISTSLLNLMDKEEFDFQGAIDYLMNLGLGFEPWRANRIARTEIVTASSHSRLLAAKETGLELKKEWITTIDGRERDAHRSADGQIVDLDEKYTVGGEKVRYPSDPTASAKNRINCRCADAYIPIEQ
jgi:hypothetical protein